VNRVYRIDAVRTASRTSVRSHDHIRAREIEKEKRKFELKQVEEVLKKTIQVKFLVNSTELENMKKFASISNQTQSEFIRSSIRDMIDFLLSKEERMKSGKNRENSVDETDGKGQENILRLQELQKIRKILDKLD